MILKVSTQQVFWFYPVIMVAAVLHFKQDWFKDMQLVNIIKPAITENKLIRKKILKADTLRRPD